MAKAKKAASAVIDFVAPKKPKSPPLSAYKSPAKVQARTIIEPQRMAFPGIYSHPSEIAAEAASRIAPESPNLKRLFGVNRDDLYEIGKDLRGNLPGTLPGAAVNPRGSAAAESIMNPKNVQRILDVNYEAEKYPELVRGMDPWYVMTPYYKRMVELLGPERAAFEYRLQNTLMGMASPGSEVTTEIPRGSAAYFLHKQGRFPEFMQFMGVPATQREAAGVPKDIIDVPGHMYHKTAQALPMDKFLRTGEFTMTTPKVPMYIEASGVPQIGFQTQTPVGDAHWSRAVGLADTRGAKTSKGKEVVPGGSVSNPEMTQLAPWWRDKIAAQLGIESVPAQARTWGAFSGQTGVTTPIGSPKLEMIADKIVETAQRLGVSPETARDMVMTGEARMGKKDGGIVDSAPEEAIKNTITDPQAFKMLDMDLANLALMNQQMQPRRMAEGGIMNDIYNNVIPAQVRTYAETMFGNRSPITEKNFSSAELDMMRDAIASSRRDRTVTNNRLHQEQLAGAKNDKERMSLLRQGPSPKIDQTVGYQHYPNSGDDSVRGDNSIGYDAAVRNTLGRFAYEKDADGNLIATDTYKFRDDLPGQTRPSSDYAKMSTAEKIGTLLKDSFGKDGDIGTLLSRAGSAFIGADGRPVNVNLGKAKFAHGGAVQRFDDGGEVSQDQMRYELDRANSPVMQATPRSPVQDFIGTVGGYMDRAGKFVSEAIEPTAEKHPVKHFLANMLLADWLKGAGTLMQDLTGTARETDEDNPVRGVIDKDWRKLSTSTEPLLDPRALDLAGFATPVVKGITKLGQAGAKAITPFAKTTAEMAAELYGSGKVPGMVAPNAYMAEPSAPKPAKALAPANEQGFYSPTEAAALNLQRKTGNGQAFLNDILKGENVRPDEIKAMGLDTFLKGRTSVTAAEVQDYIAQNKLGLGESRYDDSITENPMGIPEHKETKFKQYSLPGGKNYREVVITMPTEGRGLSEIELDKINRRLVDKGYDGLDEEQRAVAMRGGNEAMDMLQDLEDRVGIKTNDLMKTMAGGDPRTQYRSSHFDEPNILAHLRMSDRLTDGKKTLLVDEVQSDWHQAGRERGYRTPEAIAKQAEINQQLKRLDLDRLDLYDELKAIQSHDPNYPFNNDWLEASKKISENTKQQSDLKEQALSFGSIPDAPYKEDWYQLALRRAVKEAIDGGYDRVALPTGARVNERFDLSKQISEVYYSGTNLKAYDLDGNEVISQTGIKPDDLPSYIGKETANKLLEQPKQGTLRSLTGLDLQVGDKGNKKWYDEIYPGYLKKFGKKYGATVGSTTVDVRGKNEPLHYMDITPAMRKEFSTGIHMKKGGKVSFASNVDAMRHELTKAK